MIENCPSIISAIKQMYPSDGKNIYANLGMYHTSSSVAIPDYLLESIYNSNSTSADSRHGYVFLSRTRTVGPVDEKFRGVPVYQELVFPFRFNENGQVLYLEQTDRVKLWIYPQNILPKTFSYAVVQFIPQKDSFIAIKSKDVTYMMMDDGDTIAVSNKNEEAILGLRRQVSCIPDEIHYLDMVNSLYEYRGQEAQKVYSSIQNLKPID